jgi:hypothetical protein
MFVLTRKLIDVQIMLKGIDEDKINITSLV